MLRFVTLIPRLGSRPTSWAQCARIMREAFKGIPGPQISSQCVYTHSPSSRQRETTQGLTKTVSPSTLCARLLAIFFALYSHNWEQKTNKIPTFNRKYHSTQTHIGKGFFIFSTPLTDKLISTTKGKRWSRGGVICAMCAFSFGSAFLSLCTVVSVAVPWVACRTGIPRLRRTIRFSPHRF